MVPEMDLVGGGPVGENTMDSKGFGTSRPLGGARFGVHFGTRIFGTFPEFEGILRDWPGYRKSGVLRLLRETRSFLLTL